MHACLHGHLAPQPLVWEVIKFLCGINADMVVCLLQSYKELKAINLQAEMSQIPSDLRLYWYTAENGVRLYNTSACKFHAAIQQCSNLL